MITFDAALALLAERVQPLGAEDLPLAAAAGRVLASPLYARLDSPRQAVSAMDGYAVIEAVTHPGATVRVVGEARAGAGFVGEVKAGEAVRIFTGAPVPQGADCVIMQEYAEQVGPAGAGATEVRFGPGYGPARYVRLAGSDFKAGDLLLPAGTYLDARAMVAAAAADRARLAVAIRPRVTILGTGDELAPPGSAYLTPYAIPESVTFGVAAMAQATGACVVDRQVAVDDLPGLRRIAPQLLDQADVVIVTGGASVGERDFAKPMFADCGLDLVFANVSIKPGKPVWLGRARGRWVLGLPGNPTSAMVTAALFMRPLLARLQGQAIGDILRWRSLPLSCRLAATGDRETFVRATWDEGGLRPITNQESGVQAGLAQADWLIRCPPRQAELPPSAHVHALAF